MLFMLLLGPIQTVYTAKKKLGCVPPTVEVIYKASRLKTYHVHTIMYTVQCTPLAPIIKVDILLYLI